ncbi:hypothetical protein MHYP_G00348530 [Metynnis hypsauchen]
MEKLWTVLLVELVTLLGTTNGYYNERRSQCLYRSRDLSDMVYIDSYIFNKIEFIRFNSTVGKYVGFTEFGIKNADRWNSDTAFLQPEQGGVDTFCKHNAEIYYPHIIDKSVPPKIKLRSVKQSSGGHPAMLMCSAYDFYPKTIDVYWLRDGQKVTSDVTSTEEMADGDWYYQIHSHLEYTPKSGEKISCVVEHILLFLSLRRTRSLSELQDWCWGSSCQLLDSSTTRRNPQHRIKVITLKIEASTSFKLMLMQSCSWYFHHFCLFT